MAFRMKIKHFNAIMLFCMMVSLFVIAMQLMEIAENMQYEAQATRDVIKAGAMLNHLDNRKY
jgi:hypothetical protein